MSLQAQLLLFEHSHHDRLLSLVLLLLFLQEFNQNA
jgi:hypothetical protein